MLWINLFLNPKLSQPTLNLAAISEQTILIKISQWRTDECNQHLMPDTQHFPRNNWREFASIQIEAEISQSGDRVFGEENLFALG